MAHVKRRCDQCGRVCNGYRLCHTCDYARRKAPLGSCKRCKAPLHRRSTRPEDRHPGGKFHGSHGYCTGCLKHAIKAGKVQPKERDMKSAPQPRIIVKAMLTTEERAEALCAQVDPEVFFPEQGGTTTDAKKVCARCPIRERCLEVAMINRERFGVFGGLSEPEREHLHKERARGTA